MPRFRITGRGRKSNRRRNRIYQAIDRDTAIRLANEDHTAVDEAVELPGPPASPEQIAQAESLGIALSEHPDRTEAVLSVLAVLSDRCHTARIIYSETIEGEPWETVVEPCGFRRSKRGVRLRCYLPEDTPLPEIITADEFPGWHLYLVDDIKAAFDTGQQFIPRSKC